MRGTHKIIESQTLVSKTITATYYIPKLLEGLQYENKISASLIVSVVILFLFALPVLASPKASYYLPCRRVMEAVSLLEMRVPIIQRKSIRLLFHYIPHTSLFPCAEF